MRVGRRAVRFTVADPPDGITQPEVPVYLPGFVARRRMHQAIFERSVLAGHRSVMVAHDGGGSEARAEVTALLGELQAGEYADMVLADGAELVPVAHSLGGGRTVASVEELRRGGVNIDKIILEAPACFGGVRPWMGPKSLATEMHYMAQQRMWNEFNVGKDAISYMKESGALGLADEILYAMKHPAHAHTQWLIEDDVQIVGIAHPHDQLIDTDKATRGLKKAGVTTVIEVEAPFAAHNAQLYAADAVFEAMQKAIAALRRG